MSTESKAVTTRVVHCMQEKYDVYIGRGKGIWGNPYTHKDGTQAIKVSTREEAIEKYREYILGKPELLEKLGELKGKKLGCWCVPNNDCHGRILVELIEERYKDDL